MTIHNVLYGSMSYVLDNPVAARLLELANKWRGKDLAVAKAFRAMAVRVEAEEHVPGEVAKCVAAHIPEDMDWMKTLFWVEFGDTQECGDICELLEAC